MKKLKITLLVFLGAILIFANIILIVMFMQKYLDTDFFTNDYLSKAERISNLDLDGGNIVKSIDTHGGFFGEGDTLVEIQYSSDKFNDIVKEISVQEHWGKLPMNEELEKYLLGLDFELPEKGYYLFYDRHNDAKFHYDYKAMMRRHSINFSFLIVDEDAEEVIYMEKDT
ncbi:MAG: hypothetical protein J1F22_08895 [Lachnospiraceae bacterium]|nr:hypothetical protein [Lachnospiraceae bacterium]